VQQATTKDDGPRIFGKDEVASSNLASSSITQKSAQSSGLLFYFAAPDLKDQMRRE